MDLTAAKKTEASGGSEAVTELAFSELISQLLSFRNQLEDAWRGVERTLPALPSDNRLSAENLVHYLALRRNDIRDLQKYLARHGMSSLGRSESHVMWNITKVIELLYRLSGTDVQTTISADAGPRKEGSEILRSRTEALLGPRPENRNVWIMVTLPTEAGDDYDLVRDLILSGMNCARVNCAHDNAHVWKRMIDNVVRARKETGKDCLVVADIAGPKLRTGLFAPGPRVIKIRPKRNIFGEVVIPALVWITDTETPRRPPIAGAPELHFPSTFLGHVGEGSKLRFVDARGSKRQLTLRKTVDGAFWGEAAKTAYIVPQTVFSIKHPVSGHDLTSKADGIPPSEQSALVRKGDTVLLVRDKLGLPATILDDGTLAEPATIPCTLPEVFSKVRPGEPIWFDDGKVGGIIESTDRDLLTVRVTHAGPKGQRLAADKGINLPDTDLQLPALTSKDREDLKFIVDNADIVGYSFVNSAADLENLRTELNRLGGKDLGIILKIETKSAFERLPELLLSSLESRAVGVMIARGDLAVECGFERLAEVQEEILWMCEAAHIPVIWATQVLEQLSKKGIYSRAEITDAAMSERAECVMLNKGPFITDAVRTLDNILVRMEPHQQKKRSMMRPLKIAENFFRAINTRLNSNNL